MRRAWLLLVLVGGCGAPFTEVKPSAPHGGVALVYCGSASTSAESVMKSLEPPTGQVGESSMPEQKELRVCLRLENKGDKVAKVDRSDFELRCPHETDSWAEDHDDVEVIAHPGETRELHVSFRYSPLVHGEDVQVMLDKALTVGGARVKLAPIVLRRQ
ncbi:MAG: hypothetical protein JWM53_2191 [bacterium]|nr:hypothetical protein [bacterium]